MMTKFKRVKIPAVADVCLSMGSCDNVRVYGYSSCSGYNGYGVSIYLGRRIF